MRRSEHDGDPSPTCDRNLNHENRSPRTGNPPAVSIHLFGIICPRSECRMRLSCVGEYLVDDNNRLTRGCLHTRDGTRRSRSHLPKQIGREKAEQRGTTEHSVGLPGPTPRPSSSPGILQKSRMNLNRSYQRHLPRRRGILERGSK